MFQDHFAVLNVSESDSFAVIKREYRRLIKLVHPDKAAVGGSLGHSAAPAPDFYQVSLAFAVLSDENARRSFVAERRRRLLQGDREADTEREGKTRGVVCPLDVDDCDWHEESATYSYTCRCGGTISATEAALLEGATTVACSECSIIFVFEWEEEVSD